MLINPVRVFMLLGIARPVTNQDRVIFPNVGIDKVHIFELFERKGTIWFGKLPTGECAMLLRFLNIILVQNLLPTTHKIDITNDMVHLVVNLMEGKALHVPAIMCYVMLQASTNLGTKRRLPYGVMITQLMEQCRMTYLRDVVVLPQGLPIDDGIVHRMLKEGGLKSHAKP